MAQKTNSIERFWKELKRRNVAHVITVYAAVAFVILQLVDMVSKALHFPEWTQGFIIVLLCIGFIIAVFVSWVYDITPAGVKKTKPVSELKRVDHATHAVSSRWKIATYISGSVFVVLIAFNFISRRNFNTDISKLDKSIAVLPFINDSGNDSSTYFINGLMEEILNNLQKIGAFNKVLSRTSTEQYRGTNKPPIPKIAKDLDVNFVVEGSGQKYGNFYRIRVQLIAGKTDKHLWADSYESEIRETKDIYGTQIQIAQAIAAELKATITPKEKQLIEKVHSGSLTAYDFYQRGNDEVRKGNLVKARNLYKKALVCDSTFALAYAGLAHVYWDKNYFEEYYSETFMDSVRILCDIALSYNDQLESAYSYRGFYYWHHGLPGQAVKDYDKAIEINSNSYLPYYAKGYLYENDDLEKCIYNLQKAAALNHGPELPTLINRLSFACNLAGFMDIAEKYNLQTLELDGDSTGYFYRSGVFENQTGNFVKSIEYANKAYHLDSIGTDLLFLMGEDYMCIGKYKEALVFYKKWISIITDEGQSGLDNMYHIGFVYEKNGYKKEADSFFEKQIEYCNESIKSQRPYFQSSYAFYDRACINAFMGNKEKAYEDLRKFNKRKRMTVQMVTQIKNDPFFNSIRNESDFQLIVRDIEAKYQAEHERVRKWLEETGQL